MLIKIMIIAGTRPELIKLAPLIRLIEKDQNLSLIFIYSGQHYDTNLFTNLINELELPQPSIDIHVGSGSHAYQTGTNLIEIEKIILKYNPDIVISEGDTNTVLASALAARKLNKCFMHLEAGIRSFDEKMPEEVNRILIADCSMYHLAPTERAAINLSFEGIPPDSIYIVGNTIVDAVLQAKNFAESKSKIFNNIKIKKKNPIVLITLHRPANVDVEENIKLFCNTLIELKDFQFIFPIHPRTMKNLKKFKLLTKLEKNTNVLITDPLKYLDFIKIFINSLCVLTDSGGIQEEASILKIPCITLRNNTERPETIEYESNILVGMDMEKLKTQLYQIKSDPNYLKGKAGPNPFGDGKTSNKVIEIIKKLYMDNKLEFKSSKLWKNIPSRILKKIENQQDQISVKNYELQNKTKIQLIFDKNGIPHFPSKNRVLNKHDLITIKNQLPMK